MAIKIIHVGVGARGCHWLDIVSEHPDFVSVACVDKDEKALQVARSLPGQEHAKFLTSLEDALSQVKADMVLIASPSSLHAEHTVKAMDAGLGVMVEKPFAISVQEAKSRDSLKPEH